MFHLQSSLYSWPELHQAKTQFINSPLIQVAPNDKRSRMPSNTTFSIGAISLFHLHFIIVIFTLSRHQQITIGHSVFAVPRPSPSLHFDKISYAGIAKIRSATDLLRYHFIGNLLPNENNSAEGGAQVNSPLDCNARNRSNDKQPERNTGLLE